MSRGSTLAALTLGCVALLAFGCSDSQPSTPVAPGTPGTAAQKPGEPGAASDRMLFQARLAAVGDSHAAGVMSFEIVGGSLTATVHAAGLAPRQRIPQHIHVNPTCSPGGGILINLDENLTVAGEGPGVGTAYPLANQAGVVNYEASRPLSELLIAVNAFFGAGLGTVEDLLAWVDLENRNAHMRRNRTDQLTPPRGEQSPGLREPGCRRHRR